MSVQSRTGYVQASVTKFESGTQPRTDRVEERQIDHAEICVKTQQQTDRADAGVTTQQQTDCAEAGVTTQQQTDRAEAGVTTQQQTDCAEAVVTTQQQTGYSVSNSGDQTQSYVRSTVAKFEKTRTQPQTEAGVTTQPPTDRDEAPGVTTQPPTDRDEVLGETTQPQTARVEASVAKSRDQTQSHVRVSVAKFETDVATSDCKQPFPPQANAKPMSQKEKQPKICSFPGYEQKEVSSIPLVIPDNFKHEDGSAELEKVTDLQRLNLHPHSDALKLLNSIEKPVSVLTICGPARGGKSYILSRVLGHPGAFKSSNTMDVQTYGVWMGTHYLDFGEYAMILLDTEGTDAVDSESDDDISILLLATLLSSCLIYNSKNVPAKHDLQTLE